MEAIHLRASRCGLCGGINHPPRGICPRCGPRSRGSLEIVELPERGRVVTYTVLHYPPEGYPSPMMLAVVEIEGVRLIGRVMGELERLGEGCEVEVVEGEKVPYLFRLRD